MRARRAAGFTYVGLIVLVAVIGLVGAATLKVDALLRRAAAEQELLEIGFAFSEALRTYAEATPRGQPAQPPSLQDLLRDPRVPGVRRHLRKIFVDPVTGKAEWGIVWANPSGETGVLAVYSLSQAKPLKLANFDARFAGFENKDHLSDWKFAATGQGVTQGQVRGQLNGPNAAPAPVPAQAADGAQVQPSLFPAVQPAPAPAPAPEAPAQAEPLPPSERSGDGREEKEDKAPAAEGDKDGKDAEPAPAEDRR